MPCHRERAWVPSDMHVQRVFLETKRRVLRGDAMGGVIADDYDRSGGRRLQQRRQLWNLDADVETRAERLDG